jgi:HK97 family phage portal protein
MASFKNPVQWLLDWANGKAGTPRVTEKTALMSAPFWYGVNRISANLGTLPCNLRRTLPNGGSEKLKSDDRYWLFRDRPNVFQSPMVFQQAETKRAIMWGNSRSVIVGTGRQVELLPQPPSRSISGMVDGEKWHCFAPELDSRIVRVDDLMQEMMSNPNKTVMKPDREVLHVQGFGDGVQGLSLIEYARTSLQIALAADDNTLKQNTKGFNGKVMLEAPEGSAYFNDETKAKEFLKDFQDKHGRDGNADAIGLLRNGIKLNVLQMSNKDAEFIEQLKFRRQEAALWLLLESILGDDSSVSYNSLEQKQLAYLTNCLMPWLVRWEQEASRKLLTEGERRNGLAFKFNFSSILRADSQATATVLNSYIQNRVYSPNEVRIKLDENPYDGGDEYENPNITTGTPGTPEPEQLKRIEHQSNAAIVNRLQHMMTIEEKKVSKFLARGDSFEHIDDWYEKWVDTLGNAVEQLGGDWVMAQQHCANSLAYIQRGGKMFDLTGSAEALADQIEGNQ